jgi:enediyne biosynthesis protein E4
MNHRLSIYARTRFIAYMARTRFIALIALLLAACATQTPNTRQPTMLPMIGATALTRPLAASSTACNNSFVPHQLAFETTIAGPPFEVLDANGSGLALGDLNADGRIDIVFGNLNGPNAIFWNKGSLQFEKQDFGTGQVRAVTIVDTNADERLDIVVAQRSAKPLVWQNTGATDPQQRFVESSLPGVNNEAYTLNWSDLDGNGSLELITGSYDTELLKQRGLIFTQQGGGVGVFVYRRTGETYEGQRLADKADALAIVTLDLNRDGLRDIVVGNDFNRRDMAFLQNGNGWVLSEPFARTTENTMSLDIGDVENNGSFELFATDMKPFKKDTSTMAEWLPMMKKLTKPLTADDPQYAENTLQTQNADGTWRNIGYDRMLDSSGWSWSGKFGDLDNDGFLDAYIVNGMMARGLFDQLPNQELVEQNMAFQNDGKGIFHPAPQWGLGQLASGRSMSMADLDGDGDLDIVVNNVNAPAVVMENRLCGGNNLLVDVRWQDTQNLYAIGTQLTLETSIGTLTREVKAASGYLSGDTAQVHFGIPRGTTIGTLHVRWPDGNVSVIHGIAVQQAVLVTR